MLEVADRFCPSTDSAQAVHQSLTLAPLERAAKVLITEAGENSLREGLLRTPQRFARAIEELSSGYRQTLEQVVGEGIFAAEGDGLVSVREVEFYSLCEHHLLPFWGKASVAYYPGKKILGLSKIPRVLDLFARRFQVQERLTRELADALYDAIAPRAVAVRIEAQHLCMMMRGIKKQNSDTVTEFSRGLDQLSPHEQSRLFESLTR